MSTRPLLEGGGGGGGWGQGYTCTDMSFGTTAIASLRLSCSQEVKAVELHFPNAQHHGCYYHFMQAMAKGAVAWSPGRIQSWRQCTEEVCPEDGSNCILSTSIHAASLAGHTARGTHYGSHRWSCNILWLNVGKWQLQTVTMQPPWLWGATNKQPHWRVVHKTKEVQSHIHWLLQFLEDLDNWFNKLYNGHTHILCRHIESEVTPNTMVALECNTFGSQLVLSSIYSSIHRSEARFVARFVARFIVWFVARFTLSSLKFGSYLDSQTCMGQFIDRFVAAVGS